MDATTLSLPIVTVVSVVGASATLVAWVFSTFKSKIDSTSDLKVIENRLTAHETLLSELARSINTIGNDVAFIRGKMDATYNKGNVHAST
jgi:hypothetical protein